MGNRSSHHHAKATTRRSISLSDDDILYCDTECVAVNKAAGWPVHATRDPARPHLEGAVRSHLASTATPVSHSDIAVVHRLDLWTSGVVLLARNCEAARNLTAQFAERTVTKTYEAVCVNGPAEELGQLKHYLAKRREAGRDVMTPVRSGGKVALSTYAVVGRSDTLSLIEFELLTGRTHQLRVQAAADGWPILGDDVYGNGYDSVAHRDSPHPAWARRPGQLLHARRITFDHPTTGTSITVEAKPPDDFEMYAAPLRSPTSSIR